MFFTFRGHGRSSGAPSGWSYADLTADLAAVADAYDARRALGVSMGAGALCRLLAAQPDRFERLVFFLPAVLDTPRPAAARGHLAALAAAVESGAPDELAQVIAAEVPRSFAGSAAAGAYVKQRMAALHGLGAGIAGALRALPDQIALDDASALRAVTAPALVVTSKDDPQHPVEVAERLAELLPNATLHVYDEPGILWTARADLRKRLATFLNP